MLNRITIITFTISVIALFYVLLYPVNSVSVPYVPTGTITCGGSVATTSFAPPTAITSNAIIGPGYTYYYSNIIIISNKTCTVNGPMYYHRVKVSRG